jgi:hypothetical protein
MPTRPNFMEMIQHELSKVNEELIPLQNRADILAKKQSLLTTFLNEADRLYPDSTREIKREAVHARYRTKVDLEKRTVTTELPPALPNATVHPRGALTAAIEALYTTDTPRHISDIAKHLVSIGHYPNMDKAVRNLRAYFARGDDRYVRVSPGTYRKRIGDTTIGEIVGAKSKTL